MILSFHPCFTGDRNIVVAGRDPNADDLEAVRLADAVILPQGCRQSLYEMVRNNCDNVFPNYDARFSYPEKIGQAHLFAETGVPCPATEAFPSLDDFFRRHGKFVVRPPVGFPFVFKFNWGGEGDNVFLIRSLKEFRNALQKAGECEKNGQKGFLVQEFIPCRTRTLRVAIIGTRIISYWRIHESTESFYANLAKGGSIDVHTDPHLQDKAAAALKSFAGQTGINLAGFDFLFSEKEKDPEPLFLEINYFFGRRGLGGCSLYYEMLVEEISKWIADMGLAVPPQPKDGDIDIPPDD